MGARSEKAFTLHRVAPVNFRSGDFVDLFYDRCHQMQFHE